MTPLATAVRLTSGPDFLVALALARAVFRELARVVVGAPGRLIAVLRSGRVVDAVVSRTGRNRLLALKRERECGQQSGE